MSYPCRCYNRIGGKVCFTRKSLAMRPEHYAAVRYQPKCPSCGARQWHIDAYRLKKEMAYDKTCTCGGYRFWHRKGSKFCHHHPDIEKHMEERYTP